MSETPPSQRTVVLPPAVASLAEKDPSQQSGGLRFDFVLAPGEERTLKFKFPVLPGRRAVGHKWDGVSTWAQFDLNKPNPATGGILQPDPGVDFYHQLKTDDFFAQALNYWQNFVGQVKLDSAGSAMGGSLLGHRGAFRDLHERRRS